jgi:hypothetical protein
MDMGATHLQTIATDRQRRVEGGLYIGAGVFMILLSAAGFGPSLAERPGRHSPPDALLIAHAIVTAAWILFFLGQTTLVSISRTDVHRRLGFAGAALTAAVVILGYFVSIGFARRGYDLSGDIVRGISRRDSRLRDPAAILFPLSEILVFGGLVGAALWHRHRPEIHKRVMLLAMLSLATEPILHLVGHVAIYWPALQGAGGRISGPATVLLLTTSAIFDRVSNRRIHPVSLWTPVLMFAWQNLLIFVALRSVLWREIAAHLVR